MFEDILKDPFLVAGGLGLGLSFVLGFLGSNTMLRKNADQEPDPENFPRTMFGNMVFYLRFISLGVLIIRLVWRFFL